MMRCTRCAVFSLAALLAVLPGPAAAQELSEFTQWLTLAWARGDAAGIASLIAESGVSINVEGKPVGPLGTRHAAAALRRLFSDLETVGVTLASKKPQPGDPTRAYLELVWARRARGTTIPRRGAVFIAIVQQDDGWRITDIRVLP